MKSILEKIVDYKKLEVENSKKQSPIKNIEKKIIKIAPAIDFKEKLQEKNNIGKAGIIAEIKITINVITWLSKNRFPGLTLTN